MSCIEEAKLSENKQIANKSLIAENILTEKKKKKDWIQKAYASGDVKKDKLTDLLW